MTVTKYTYSISTDTANAKLSLNSLSEQISSSAIITALDHISSLGDVLDIYFKDALSAGDITILDTTVSNHDGIAIVPTELEVDDQGRQVSRAAFGRKGWTYLAHPLEFTTSKLGTCFAKTWNNVDRGGVTFKFYNAAGTELTVQGTMDTDCVETRVTITPDYDYEVISGKIEQHTSPTEDIRMWVVGGVINNTTNYPLESPAGVFHVKEFAGGINLKYMGKDQEIETDGRASKFMVKTTAGVPFQTNQFQFIIRHPAGHKHDLMIILEYFRA